MDYRIGLFAATAVAMLTSVLSGCEKEVVSEPAAKYRPVRTLLIEADNHNQTREFSAVVDAARKAELSFKVSGEIIRFFVNQGDDVKAGQVLAELDDKDIKVQQQEALSAYEAAESDFERAQELIKSNTISKSDFDNIRTKYNSAKARLATSNNNLSYTQLKASFDGVIAKKYSQKFQEVTAKSPILALHDLSKVHLKIDVPESVIINTQKDSLQPKLHASFDAIKDQTFPLTFKEVITQADEVTKTYEVTLEMAPPQHHTILPGMTATVIAEFPKSAKTSSAFHIPAHAVLKDQQGHYVYVASPTQPGLANVNRRDVVVGDLSQRGLAIHQGLQVGDLLITAGMSKLSDNMTVKHQ